MAFLDKEQRFSRVDITEFPARDAARIIRRRHEARVVMPRQETPIGRLEMPGLRQVFVKNEGDVSVNQSGCIKTRQAIEILDNYEIMRMQMGAHIDLHPEAGISVLTSGSLGKAVKLETKKRGYNIPVFALMDSGLVERFPEAREQVEEVGGIVTPRDLHERYYYSRDILEATGNRHGYCPTPESYADSKPYYSMNQDILARMSPAPSGVPPLIIGPYGSGGWFGSAMNAVNDSHFINTADGSEVPLVNVVGVTIDDPASSAFKLYSAKSPHFENDTKRKLGGLRGMSLGSDSGIYVGNEEDAVTGTTILNEQGYPAERSAGVVVGFLKRMAHMLHPDTPVMVVNSGDSFQPVPQGI